jgi:hypothetical protein
MTSQKPPKRIKIFVLNVVFVFFSAVIILFLARAPKETTSYLPKDDIHLKFYEIESKKEAEKFCLDCHDKGMEAALPDDHPPGFRCLFCHKRK